MSTWVHELYVKWLMRAKHFWELELDLGTIIIVVGGPRHGPVTPSERLRLSESSC
jgi:hypothetical protein